MGAQSSLLAMMALRNHLEVKEDHFRHQEYRDKLKQWLILAPFEFISNATYALPFDNMPHPAFFFLSFFILTSFG